MIVSPPTLGGHTEECSAPASSRSESGCFCRHVRVLRAICSDQLACNDAIPRAAWAAHPPANEAAAACEWAAVRGADLAC